MNRRERRAAGAPGRAAPDPLLAAALLAHKEGRLDRAEALYRRVLAGRPGHGEALNLLGVLRLQAGRFAEARGLLADAVAAAPGNGAAHYNLAAACQALGLPEEAVRHYRRTTELQPDHQGAWNNLGLVLRELRRASDAAEAFRAALAVRPDGRVHTNLGVLRRAEGEPGRAAFHFRQALALLPGDADARIGLADALLASGEAAAALDEACRAVSASDRPEARAVFAAAVAAVPSVPDAEPVRTLLAHALREGWARPGTLARPACALAFARLGPGASLDVLAADPLLAALLPAAPVVDRGLEALLTRTRAVLLVRLSAGDDGFLSFACALAGQCFVNEYVWDLGTEEDAAVAVLSGRVAAALAAGSPVPPASLAVLAAYRPLHTLPGTDRLVGLDWPDPVVELVARQVVEPLAERASIREIPALTPVSDAVSAVVRAQYEENPYPHWTTAAAPAGPPATVEVWLAGLFPGRPVTLPDRAGVRDVLVAGCGTGQQPVEVARSLQDARVLAVDLSLASLAYARRKSVGIPGLEYAQADLLRLPGTGRRFDVVMASGVLHHLRDPGEGWRALLAVLRPGGVMQVGLYSERARRDVSAARALIAAEGLLPTPEGIRRCRQLMLAAADGSPFRRLSLSSDFASASGCRDLLFHVQEHLLSLPWIAGFVEANGLEFLGFDVPAAVQRAFRARFPGDPGATDLRNWDALEADAPDTFAAMYQFWVRLPER